MIAKSIAPRKICARTQFLETKAENGRLEARSSISGLEMKAERRALKFSQSEMAELISCSRHAVSYWETKQKQLTWRDVRSEVPAKMLKVLQIRVSSPFDQKALNAEAIGYHCLSPEAGGTTDAAKLSCSATIDGEHDGNLRRLCGAKTRTDRACRNLSETGKRRCKFHGGMSTGPKTEEGKSRIAKAQRLRWSTSENGKGGCR